MTKPPTIHPDTVAKARDLYATLVGLTESPRDAQMILMIMHLVLWMNCKSDDISVDSMLNDYCGNFKANLRENGMVEDLQQ